jgi:PucR family transcriptional regulator, purine catabolism regulatory protein
MRTRVQIGVSPICHGPTDFASAFDDTSRMLELARSLKIARPVITADDVRRYRLLLGLSRPAEALALADAILEPLERLDVEHNSQLVRTLEAYLEHNGGMQPAAEDLEIHVNTVAYRLQRLRSLSGLDLESAETRLRLQVALHIRRAAAHVIDDAIST